MISSKTLFTDKELKIILDTDFLFTKAKIIEKVLDAFGAVKEEMVALIPNLNFNFPDEIDINDGKIFRGENYRLLPYVVLDCPKYFSKESIFAIRTMFLWGNFYSTTLHLHGGALEQYRSNITGNLDLLRRHDIFICVNSNPWQYHYEKDNYLPVDEFDNNKLMEIVKESEFIKLSRKIEIGDYRSLPSFCKESLQLFLKVLQ